VHPEDLIPFASAEPAAWVPVRRFGVGFATGTLPQRLLG
jgi:hypothetical protein